jgi:CRP-like cAMP-binding protein
MQGRKNLRCELCQAQSEGIFHSLDKSLLGEVNREKTARLYRRGEIIFQEGAPPLGVYCIHSGLAKLYKMGDGGEPLVIRLLVAGQIVGYRPMLSNEPYAATAEAVEDSVVCIIPSETLRRVLGKSKSLAFEMMARLSRELRVSEDQALSLAQSPARRRAAQLLISLHETLGRSKATHEVPVAVLQRKEMAQMIGVTPETFSRILSHFARHGLVRLTRDSIVLNNMTELERVASRHRAEA